MKVIIKRIILVFLASLGYGSGWYLLRKLKKKNNPQEVRILRYHSVNNFRKHETNVKIDEFQKQMEFLKRDYNPISLSNFVDFVREGKRIPPHSVVVTFDDGYRDNFVYAYPILKKLRIPATIFLLTDFIGTPHILPENKGDNPGDNYLLSWEEINEMKGPLISFGSHGLSHIKLGKVQPEKARKEIGESKAKIERKMGQKVSFFSYPFGTRGEFNKENKKIVSKSGYLRACSAMYGTNKGSSDPFELRRIGIEGSETMFTFKAKLNGALDILLWKETKLGTFLTKVLNFILRA